MVAFPSGTKKRCVKIAKILTCCEGRVTYDVPPEDKSLKNGKKVSNSTIAILGIVYV